MATRSHIGILNEDKIVFFVYCHFDGYPSGVGKTLKENYDLPEDVFNLLSFGDISVLKDTIEDSVFYKRDRNETNVDQRWTSLYDFLSKTSELNSGIDFKYLFNPNSKEWVCYDWQGNLIGIPSDNISSVV
jgi:hypothetical protein